MTFKKTIVGGTFDHFHKGHEELLRVAFDLSDTVFIGVSGDQFAQRFRTGEVETFKMRGDVINHYCKEFKKNYKIVEINDFYGPSTTDPDLNAIVVSEETSLRAKEINAVRTKKGLRKLAIVEIPFALSEDGKPISSERVRMGEIDNDGNIA